MASTRTGARKAAPKPAKPAKARATRVVPGMVRRRFWLTYPNDSIQSPVIWELGHKFPLVTNIRQASVTEALGIVCLEVSGSAEAVEDGLRWLKKLGLSVEPVELSAVES